MVNQTKLNPYSRSVSIIGVGCTPFMYTLDNPETEGLTEGELFGYAAYKAMEDAGVTPKDIDFYFHGQASPLNGSDYITPNIQVANWFGMRGKGSIHHSEACCTGYLALEQAVNAVASGKYNVVLSGCVEFADSLPIPGMPAHKRRKFSMEEFLGSARWMTDRAYSRSFMAPTIGFDDAVSWYRSVSGLSFDQLDDVVNHLSVANRINASTNPLALERKTYKEIANERGFDDEMAYLKSPFNPKIGAYLRLSGMELKCDGAAAVIVCPTEMASQFTKNKPIEVLGIGSSALEIGLPHVEVNATIEAVRQVYELTKIDPSELDLLYVNDFIVSSQLISAEITGYLPKGSGWKYICDGRTRITGDKPINTNGGRTSFGHAHAASGLADLYEAVMQLRGLCGERQVQNSPRTAMLRGFGGSQNVTATIIRTVD